ncbi:MAG: FecR family protein [Bacteroidales bacterium]|nr:FecR family protein [Bacteroidales bacterium]MDD2424794.1 FecR family protein [Bacteroidales bacterium]MDD3990291.1 FecR family protein [Bacteroidales bacterium]MDD4638728.1 FecR family protein [Bacteroidales bacterium]
MQSDKREDIDILLNRILNGEADSSDIEVFSLWIRDPGNEKYFEQFKDIWHLSHSTLPDPDKTAKEHDRYINYIRMRRRRERATKSLTRVFSIAAVTLILFGLYIFVNQYVIQYDYTNISLAELKYNTDSIKVVLSDGRVINPLSGNSFEDSNITESGLVIDPVNARQISYVPGEKRSIRKTTQAKDGVKFNSVSIPPGERFVIMLSDSTMVYLNSNSYLRYPVNFGEGTRHVTLSGRAYFDVTKSSKPFIVTTNDMEVEVLGTSFDVESSEAAKNSSVILVEGSVRVTANGQTKVISPNEKFTLNHVFNEVSISNIDSKTMTLWKDGILVLKELSFDQMIESLSSWYGVEIEDRSTVPETDRFNGKFDREDIKAAMKTIALSAKVKYKVREGKLVIEDGK